MDFAVSDHVHLIAETIRRFVRNELQPLEEEVEAKGFLEADKAQEIFRKSRELGFYAMNVPSEFGGGGLSAVEMCCAEQEMGQTTDILVRRAFGNVYEVLLVCDENQRKQWLLPAVRGERVCSIAMTEPGSGSDATGIKTVARPDGDGWILSGQKHFVSDGMFSDFFVVSALTDPDAGSRGISLFLVDKEMNGLTVGRDQPMMGLRGTSHVELFFDNVKLGPEHLLGERGRGLRLVFETIGRIRLFHIGARAVGMGKRVLEMMVEQANLRHQFGRSIGEFQMVQTMLADSAMDLNAATLMVLNTAWELDQGRDPREKVSMVKVCAAETLGRIADRAVQLFGGMGFCKDLPIERIYRDCRVLRIYDGTSEIHRGVVARGLLKNGVDRVL